MKKFKLLSLITSFALTFSLLSCGGGGGDDPTPTPTEDKTAPVANNVKPANNAIIELDGNSEGKIEFSADFADNVKLASYNIEIHKIEESNTSGTRVAFDYPKQSWKLDGKTASVKEPIILIKPINGKAILTGKYKLTLVVIDAAGNQTRIENELNFKDATPTEDKIAPVANNVKPANNAIIELDGNSEGKIEFSADFTDNVNLASYSIEIHRIVDSKSIESRSITRVAFDYPKQTWKIEGKAASVKEPIIPIGPINNQAILTGKYMLTLVVTDAAGNETKIEHELDFRDA